MNRIPLAGLIAAALLLPSLRAQAKRDVRADRPAQFSVVEASISDMRAALEQGRITSRELVTQYLTRIAMYEDKLHAALTVNPNALQEADALDRERAQGRMRGSAARHPDRAQRTTSSPPIPAHHRRRVGLRWLRASLRSHAGEESARRRSASSSPRPA